MNAWIERLAALLAAILALALTIPNLSPRALMSAPNGVGRAFFWAVTTTYLFAAIGLVAFIVVGQGRLRAWRIGGWVVLLVWIILKI